MAMVPNRSYGDIAKKILYLFLALIFIGAFLSLYNSPFEKIDEVSLNTLVSEVKENKVKSLEIVGEQTINIELQDGVKQKTRKELSQPLPELLTSFGIKPEQLGNIDIKVKNDNGLGYWLSALLPFLIPIIVIGVFLWIMMRQVQGTNNRAMMFGQSKARETNPKDKKRKVTFKDVAGVLEAKEELKEVVDFLKNPKKFQNLGARVPKGALLVGPPGTGKTLLARAIAGEANVPFYHISGSEFVEMFVGVGASRVRDLFKTAKKTAPSIVFVDEIDAVGRQRGTGLGGSHDEREQTLNQILVEMDGFDNETNVIIIAATNRPDVLDPALLRPGRFDRRIVLDMPDYKDREQILLVHAKNKPLAKDVNLKELAQRTPGFSGADLSNLLNEAAILAARLNKKEVNLNDCLQSIEKVLLGPERKSSLLNKKEKEITAYHEAGHALVANQLPNADPVKKVSIISRGRAAGYTLKLPIEDKHMHTRSEFLEDIAVMLAGHATEREVFKELTTGATNDLEQATKLARRLVMSFGMSDAMGPRTFGEREEMVFLGKEIAEQRDYSEKTAQLIDKEIDRIIKEGYHRALGIIRDKRKILNRIAEELLKKETLEQKDFEALVKD
ncbi:MAG: ATP-dependent zinc metalloprotease FtsH [Patescibacteria group bacterium]|jgi:cell division protease FtsH